MKKAFQMIGLISLTCFSFFVTEQTATVVNDMDEIMVEIKAKKDEYKVYVSADKNYTEDNVVKGKYLINNKNI